MSQLTLRGLACPGIPSSGSNVTTRKGRAEEAVMVQPADSSLRPPLMVQQAPLLRIGGPSRLAGGPSDTDSN